MPALILDVTEREYRNDPCPRPSLTQSDARLITSKTPAHVKATNMRLGGTRPPPTDAQEYGSLCHAMLLGTDDAVLLDFKDWRTIEARAERELLRAKGKIAMLREKFERVTATTNAMQASLHEAGIDFEGGNIESAIQWTERATNGNEVLCRGRLDWFKVHDGMCDILDLKTTNSSHPRACATHTMDYGYHIQGEAYERGICQLFPDLRGRVRFSLVFVESTPPHAVLVSQVDGAFRQLGAMKWERAIDLWERCLRTDRWPAYHDKSLQQPGYAGNPMLLECAGWAIPQMAGEPG